MASVPSYTAYAKVIVDHIAPTLKAAGFRKRRHSFNRKLDNGLIHEFSLVMMPADSCEHGRAYFHAGCYVPAAELIRRNVTDPKWVTGSLCCIRAFFNNDPKAASTGNFHLTAMSKEPSKAEVHVERALTVLEHFRTLEQIATSDQKLAGVWFETPFELLQSCIAVDQGQREHAAHLLSDYLAAAKARGSNGHAEYVEEWAKEHALL